MVTEGNVANVSVMLELTIERNAIIGYFVNHDLVVPPYQIEFALGIIWAPAGVDCNVNSLSDSLVDSCLLLANQSCITISIRVEIFYFVTCGADSK